MVGHIANTKAYGGKNSCDVAGNGRKNETLHKFNSTCVTYLFQSTEPEYSYNQARVTACLVAVYSVQLDNN